MANVTFIFLWLHGLALGLLCTVDLVINITVRSLQDVAALVVFCANPHIGFLVVWNHWHHCLACLVSTREMSSSLLRSYQHSKELTFASPDGELLCSITIRNQTCVSRLVALLDTFVFQRSIEGREKADIVLRTLTHKTGCTSLSKTIHSGQKSRRCLCGLPW